MDTAIVLISPGAFSTLILLALTAATLIPLVMLGLLIRDKRNNRLW
ncbi:MAG: hypothetical protein R3F41_06005 [Gammaproteobacteria bacterium]|nr:hypothetical protein [Pseudomonadales bacterium]MCP5348468.1 hypothetical protein [Pseudomonadales bacterium]